MLGTVFWAGLRGIIGRRGKGNTEIAKRDGTMKQDSLSIIRPEEGEGPGLRGEGDHRGASAVYLRRTL